MGKTLFTTTSLTVSAVLLASPGGVSAQRASFQRTDFYVEGRLLAESGDWIQALRIWDEAKDSLTPLGRYDPRIAVAYMELVTERNATGFYESASEIYVWGFSGTDFSTYRDVIAAEVAHIDPLFDDDDQGQWDRRVEREDPTLMRDLKRFWLEKDPSPGTPYNERLIEHWERVAYARKNFTNQRNSPYQTDDRGTIYVKFGAPDKRQAGIMGADDFELRLRTGGVDAEEGRRRLRRYDVHPNYEVWAFDGLNPQDITWYLFGNYEGTGRFQLLRSPRDLIHSSAFSPGSRNGTPGGIKASYYMELFYYGELARIGGPFGQRHSELETYWDRIQGGPGGRSAPNEEALEGFSLRYKQADDLGPDFPALVSTRSAFEGSNREMELVAMATRVLTKGQPQLIITALSSPRTFVEGVRALRRFVLESGSVDHTLIVRDESLTEVGRITDRTSSDVGDISTFSLRHISRPLHYTVVGHVTGIEIRGREPSQRLYPGQAHLLPGPPLTIDPDRLEVSDIVTGLPIPDDFDPADLHFPLVPSRTIWKRDPLRVYLEVYHLRPEAGGLHRFKADFRLARYEGDTEIIDLDRPPVTLSVDLESASSESPRVFDINVRDLLPGNYRLEVTITDAVSGQTKTRVVRLKLIQ